MVDFIAPTWPKFVICAIVFAVIWADSFITPTLANKLLWRFSNTWSKSMCAVDEEWDKAFVHLDLKGENIAFTTTIGARLCVAYLCACIIEFGNGRWFA